MEYFIAASNPRGDFRLIHRNRTPHSAYLLPRCPVRKPWPAGSMESSAGMGLQQSAFHLRRLVAHRPLHLAGRHLLPLTEVQAR